MKKLAFEYGEGLMEAELPENTDVFIPGETVIMNKEVYEADLTVLVGHVLGNKAFKTASVHFGDEGRMMRCH